MTAHNPALRHLADALPEEVRSMVRPAAELARHRHAELRDPPLATSVAGLDELLEGGLPRGCVVELVGRGSSGRFATLLAALKTVTDTGETAALLDQGSQLDPQAAAAVGIDLERLLWLRPKNLPDALAAAEMLVWTGFSLVALDLGLPPVRGRAPLAAWLRLARSSAGRRTAVLVGSPYHVSGCAAAVVVSAGRGRGRWSGAVGSPRLLEGLHAHLEVLRRRGRRPHEAAPTAFVLPEAAFAPLPDHDRDRADEEVSHAQAL